MKSNQGEDKNAKNDEKDEIFPPKIVRIEKKAKIADLEADGFIYISGIEKKTEAWARKDIGELGSRLIENLVSLLSPLKNEPIKDPVYRRLLKEGYLPLSIKNEEIDWKATIVERKELEPSIFQPPANATKVTQKEYIRELVEKVSEDAGAKLNP